MHGGVAKEELKKENLDALRTGFSNLKRHIENVQKFGVPVIVSINRFSQDTEPENELLYGLVRGCGVPCVQADHWASGGKGAEGLAHQVIGLIEKKTTPFQLLYPDEMPLAAKIKQIATTIYGAADVAIEASALKRLDEFEKNGFGHLPVCIAKTQYSFTTDPTARGAPSGHVITVREVRLSAGAEFVVAVCGDILTMPGLPRVPAANAISVTSDGRITGLF
jgi:formate--tetrahydrofolate ligase